MKRIIGLIAACTLLLPAGAQNRRPSIPEAAQRKGYGLEKTQIARLDNSPAAEEVLLFGRHNGHWPEFDLFKYYFAVVDSETREVKYLSDEFVTDRYNLTVDDRDGNGVDELYYYYIDESTFQTDTDGYHPQWTYRYKTLNWVQTPDPEPARRARVKTLIIAGMDGSHYSRGAAECVRQMLENSGLFSVDVLITPDWGGDMSSFHPAFKQYGLIIINYGGVEWAPAVKKDFENYVAGGGGVVFIHSSLVPMENWEGWNKMTGLGAWNGRDEKWGPYLYMQDGRLIRDYTPGWAGYHGLQHHIIVDHQAPSHPILKGLPASWHHFKDEIYTHLRGPAENMEILATTRDGGRDEPLLWTVHYGKGRVFVDVLGHCGNDPNMTYAMTCTGYQVTFLRGCEWAATGEVTQKAPLDFPDKEHYTLRKDFKAPTQD